MKYLFENWRNFIDEEHARDEWDQMQTKERSGQLDESWQDAMDRERAYAEDERAREAEEAAKEEKSRLGTTQARLTSHLAPINPLGATRQTPENTAQGNRTKGDDYFGMKLYYGKGKDQIRHNQQLAALFKDDDYFDALAEFNNWVSTYIKSPIIKKYQEIYKKRVEHWAAAAHTTDSSGAPHEHTPIKLSGFNPNEYCKLVVFGAPSAKAGTLPSAGEPLEAVIDIEAELYPHMAVQAEEHHAKEFYAESAIDKDHAQEMAQRMLDDKYEQYGGDADHPHQMRYFPEHPSEERPLQHYYELSQKITDPAGREYPGSIRREPEMYPSQLHRSFHDEYSQRDVAESGTPGQKKAIEAFEAREAALLEEYFDSWRAARKEIDKYKLCYSGVLLESDRCQQQLNFLKAVTAGFMKCPFPNLKTKEYPERYDPDMRARCEMGRRARGGHGHVRPA